MATTAPAPRRENVLTRKIGPLQTWIWVVIVLTPIVIYGIVKHKSAAATAAATNAADNSGMTDASQVPQFVNQTYTTVEPPTAPGSLPTTPPGGGLLPPVIGPGDGPVPPVAATGGGGVQQGGGPVQAFPGVGGTASSGLYYHAKPGGGGKPYFSSGGRAAIEGSGNYKIGGKTYYYHASPKSGAPYFTLNGKRVRPPSGTVVKG